MSIRSSIGSSHGGSALTLDRLLFRPDISQVGADRGSVMRCRWPLLRAIGRRYCCHCCCQPRSVREGDRCSPSSSFLPPLGYEPYGMRLLRLCQSLCRGLTSGGSALKPPTGMSRTSSVRRSLATGWLMTCQPFGAFSSHIPSTSTDQMSVGTLAIRRRKLTSSRSSQTKMAGSSGLVFPASPGASPIRFQSRPCRSMDSRFAAAVAWTRLPRPRTISRCCRSRPVPAPHLVAHSRSRPRAATTSRTHGSSSGLEVSAAITSPALP